MYAAFLLYFFLDFIEKIKDKYIFLNKINSTVLLKNFLTWIEQKKIIVINARF